MMSGDILTDREAAYISNLETDVEAMRKALRMIAAASTLDDSHAALASIQGICRVERIRNAE